MSILAFTTLKLDWFHLSKPLIAQLVSQCQNNIKRNLNTHNGCQNHWWLIHLILNTCDVILEYVLLILFQNHMVYESHHPQKTSPSHQAFSKIEQGRNLVLNNLNVWIKRILSTSTSSCCRSMGTHASWCYCTSMDFTFVSTSTLSWVSKVLQGLPRLTIGNIISGR